MQTQHTKARPPRPHPHPHPRPRPRPARICLCCAFWIVLALGSGQALADPVRDPLPDPVINPHSTEICLNSRRSYHGGWSGEATDQMLANVLYATSRASVVGSSATIYAATPSNVYVYDPRSNSLIIHKAGDWRSDPSAAFEVGVAADNAIAAGAAMHLAQLESIALWTETAGQLASCPRATATTYANSYWDPPDPLDIVVSFGILNVAGFTTNLVAISSDGSLPNPRVDGTVYMDTVLGGLAYGSSFDTEDLTLDEVSQLLWASYGCSDHRPAGGKAGLVCASAVANYYLTRRIYAIGPDGVYRYHNRLPPGTDATTRDHRIELVRPGDTRPALRQEAAGLPIAPRYLVICVGSPGDWPELEVGFAAMGSILEASTIGCQGYLTAGFSPEVQGAIREVTGIPTTDLPMAIVSLGHPANPLDVDATISGDRGLVMSIRNSVVSDGLVEVRYELPLGGATSLVIYDLQGHEVRRLIAEKQESGPHLVVWDCRDAAGRPVPSGVYFCRLRAGRSAAGAQVVVLR